MMITSDSLATKGSLYHMTGIGIQNLTLEGFCDGANIAQTSRIDVK